MLNKRPKIFIFFLFFFGFVSFFLFYFSKKNHITLEKVFDSGLPVLMIDTDNKRRISSKENYVKADFYIYENYDAYLKNEGFQKKGKIRGRGNTTWTFRKKPYLAKLNSEESILGLPSARKWVLLSLMCDKSKVRNAYATFLAKNIWTKNVRSPDFRFVSLCLNGEYEGIYCIYEKVEQGINRISLPKDSFLFVVNSRYSRTEDGNEIIYEGGSTEYDGKFGFRSEHGVPFTLKDLEVSEEDFIRGKNILQEIENKIYEEDNSSVFKYIDKDSFTDWYLLQEFSKNRDSSFLASCFMFINGSDNKIYMGPPWDFDIAFGGSHMDNNFSPEDSWINKFHWYKELWRNEEFKQAVKMRWLETRDALRKSFEYIHKESNFLEEAAFLDDSVWHTIGKKQWPLTPGYKDRKTYKAEVDYVYDWCVKRFDWMDSYIENL